MHHVRDRDGGIRTHPRRVTYLRDVSRLEQVPPSTRELLQRVSGRYAFRSNDYYLGLIDWSDPADPIKTLVIPHEREMGDFGGLDVSNEAANTVVPGVQHKYRDTCVLLCVDTCAGFCRYCFRKRLFMRGNRETARDVRPGLDYIRAHAEITDVLLTGGDPLVLGTDRLACILRSLREIPHVRTVRIGSKIPAFNPFRILEDPSLHELLEEECSAGGCLHLMCHFDHPREFTSPARDALRLLRKLGVICVNQCPVVRGVNDDAAVLAELFQECTELGCPQYYVFQLRPTAGNEPYVVPISEGWELFSEARSRVSGLSRRARYVMSHESGKVQVVGMDERRIFMRYHRAKNPADESRFMVMRRDDHALWFDDLNPVSLSA